VIERQASVRSAERHLQYVEEEYSRAVHDPGKIKPRDVALEYKEAIDFYISDMEEVYRKGRDSAEALANFRKRLIDARYDADRMYENNYYWWSGYGESLVQMKVRSGNPREKLYSTEAYAEKLYFAGATAVSQAAAGNAKLSQDMFESVFVSPEACFVHEWINYYGPRRSIVFGSVQSQGGTVNSQTIQVDQEVRSIVEMARQHGGEESFWGWLYSGATDKLRYLVSRQMISASAAKDLIESSGVVSLENFILAAAQPPGATAVIAVHAHNADMDTLRETFSHAVEVNWKYDNRWVVLGTDTDDIKLAEQERRMALDLGITRYAVGARQHLKAGNQNRIMPNVPVSGLGESFYLTLDDDYSAASNMLHRVIPLMTDKQDFSFVQIPLYFRANSELGYSRLRTLDASIVYSSFPSYFAGVNDLNPGQKQEDIDAVKDSFVTPLGTGCYVLSQERARYFCTTDEK
jgi:hypothetical protein